MSDTKKGRQPRVTPLEPTFPGRAFRCKPHDMDHAPATAEQVAVMQRIALGVFTDMSNAGYSLRETLAAIYLTGAQHAISVLKGAG